MNFRCPTDLDKFIKSKYDKEIKILKFPRKYKLYRKMLTTITDV